MKWREYAQEKNISPDKKSERNGKINGKL